MTVHIYVYLNNTTIINCLNSIGGTCFIECNSAAKDIWQFFIEREIWISAALIPGKNNTQADRESRVFIDNTRWNCLRPDIFQQVTKIWLNHLLTSLSLS